MPGIGGRLALGLVRLYRLTFGRLLGGGCRFHPSCSEYAELAVRSRGAAIGLLLAVWRIVRCGPWSRGGVDYPPARTARRASLTTEAGGSE